MHAEDDRRHVTRIVAFTRLATFSHSFWVIRKSTRIEWFINFARLLFAFVLHLKSKKGIGVFRAFNRIWTKLFSAPTWVCRSKVRRSRMYSVGMCVCCLRTSNHNLYVLFFCLRDHFVAISFLRTNMCSPCVVFGADLRKRERESESSGYK